MNINMKKTTYILFAAALAMASASCAREEIFDNVRTGEVRTFTCSLGEEQTKTDITMKGKTVWSENDSLLVSNGTDEDIVVVDKKSAGEKYFSFETQLTGKIYVVYPHNAAKSVEEGKFTLEVPGVQDGTFGSANIACAIADENNTVKMKNVTSVVKFRVPQTNIKINTVSISSLKDSLAGIFTVDLTSGSPVVTKRDVASSASGVNLNLAGKSGNFYATVIPGSYDAGFSLTAVSLDLEHAYESMSTKSATELKANDLYDLGRIGENLKPIGGKGTQADPYQITNLAELTALANVVNNGDSMEGKYIKVMNDIKGVNTTIGYFDDAQPKDKDVYFKGDFDGNGKTITLNLKQTAKKSLALIGDAAYPANIHDVIVDGTVNSTYNYAAGVCAMINGGQGSRITNCTNKATINGSTYVGGIVGYCDGDAVDGLVVSNCKNTADVTGTGHSIGGITGYGHNYTSFINSTNEGIIKGHDCVGGIVGEMGNKKGAANLQIVSKCVNNGDIDGTFAVAGIVGAFDFHINSGNTTEKRVLYCVNNGEINSNGRYNEGNTANKKKDVTCAGGILGRACGVYVVNSNNTGKVITTDGHKATAGVVGYAYNIDAVNCINKGEVKGYAEVGGIYGYCFCSTISNCGNEAPISALYYVGGIIGTVTRTSTFNSYNTGRIYADKNQSDIGAGGLLGNVNKDNSKYYQSYLRNCYNSGDVIFKGTNLEQVSVGGLVGIYFRTISNYGGIENVYNSGKVSSEDGTESTWQGGLCGAVQTKQTVTNCFMLSGSSKNIFGLINPSCKPTNYSLCDADGTLETTVTIAKEKFSNSVAALNGYIKNVKNGDPTWLKWKLGEKGPELIFQNADHPLNSGDSGLDIGNGGNI